MVDSLLLRLTKGASCNVDKCFNAVHQCLLKAGLFGLGLLIADFIIGSDSTYIFSTYSTKFGCDSGHSSNGKWLLLIMSTTNSASQPGASTQTYAILASMFNRRQMILAGAVAMFMGFLFCFYVPPLLQSSHRIWILALAQGVVSIGAAAFASLPDLVLNENLNPTELGTWRTAETAAQAFGSVMGGPMGAGLASRTSSWYWMFLLEATISGVAVVVLGWGALPLREKKSHGSGEDVVSTRESGKRKADPWLMLCVAAFVLLPSLVVNLATSTLLSWTMAIFISFLAAVTFAAAISSRIHRVSEEARPWSTSEPKSYAARLGIDGLLLFAYTVLYITLSSYAKIRANLGTGTPDWALSVVILGEFLGLGLAAVTVGKREQLRWPLTSAVLFGIFMFGVLSFGVLQPDQFPESLAMILLGIPKGFANNVIKLLVLGSITEQEDGNSMYALFSFAVQILGSNLAITLAPILFDAAVRHELRGVPGAKGRIDEVMKCPTAEYDADILRAVLRGHEWLFLMSMGCLMVCFVCVLSVPVSTWTKVSAPQPNETEASLLGAHQSQQVAPVLT